MILVSRKRAKVAGIAQKMAEVGSCEAISGESVAGSGFPARERHVCPDPSYGSSFSFRSALSRHVKDKHPSENNCRCHVCNKRY